MSCCMSYRPARRIHCPGQAKTVRRRILGHPPRNTPSLLYADASATVIARAACSRGKVDEPVNVMGIKRFVADWAYNHRDELPNMRNKSIVGTAFQHNPPATGKQVAIIGAGPAGLTVALDLVRLGHKVKVYDAQPEAGGMIRGGIPPHRLPYEMLDWEVQQILEEGVELQLNTWVDDIPSCLRQTSWVAHTMPC